MAASIASLVVLLAATAAIPATAQEETVWGTVAFVMYGERTPLMGANVPELTPLGAQQMYAQGSVFRARYLDSSYTNFTTALNRITTQAPIQGIEPDALDNMQLSVVSTDDSYVAAGALAFVQGLYPPQKGQFAVGNGDREAAVLANNTVIDFPLDGYQYPLIETYSTLDPASIWIEGNAACTSYEQSSLAFRDDANVKKVYDETLGFYETLWTGVFQGTFSKSVTNFYNAYDLYDYASYEYRHNPQLANALNTTAMEVLQTLAATQQFDLNGNLSVSGLERGDMIRAISGRMLATHVVTLLKQNIANHGGTAKLSLMFGSFEPFLAFFSLTGLFENLSNNGDFQDLPGAGAAMVFEMYSTGANVSEYPSIDDLWVRFLYRPNTDDDTPLTEYGLFSNDANVTSMAFSDFAVAMQAIGVPSISTWCTMCDGVSLFCAGLESGASDGSNGSDSGNGSHGKKTMAPTVAGIIGAVVTLAVVNLLMVAVIVCGRIRFYRAGRTPKTGETAPAAKVGVFGGGFKGAEKKDSDADVVVNKAGVRHERIGSWELNNGEQVSGNGGSNSSNNNDTGVARSPTSLGAIFMSNRLSADEDREYGDMVDLNAKPVKAVEHV